MTSTLDPIPNSKGVSTVLSLFSYCFTFLKNARPLPQTAHAVTSVITPGASSNAPMFLIFAGAAALLGAVYLFKTRFSPTPPPADLSNKNTTVITPSGVPSNQASGTDTAGSGQEGTGLPPPPVVHASNASTIPPAVSAQEGARLPEPLVHVKGSVVAPLPASNGEQPIQPLPPPFVPNDPPIPPTAPKPPSPLPTSSSSPTLSSEEDQRLPLEPIEPDHSQHDPAARSSVSSSPASVSSQRPSPPSSPDAGINESDSSSGSDPEARSSPPSQRPSVMGRVVASVTSFVTNTRHFSKWTKYRLIQEQLEGFARERNIDYCRPEKDAPKADVEITDAWNQLVTALLEPTRFPTADDQYRATVECLRKIRQMLVSAEPEVQLKFSRQFQFVRELSFVRFAGIELFPYCQQLIEEASKTPLPANLTLATFSQELKTRTSALNNPDASHGMNGAACQVNKAKGTLGLHYDPLLKTSNIPYQDGVISVNGRTTLLLWHGTPVTHHDPYGLAFDLVAGALSYIPLLRRFIPDSNPVSTPPVINADYIAFIEQAAVEGKNILHVILENGKKKRVGDESSRVKARLRLGVHNPNMFVMALRLDGEFFERHDRPHDAAESIQSLKGRLAEQLLLMPPLEQEDMSLSTFQKRQMEDQLAANGFCIPQKLRDASQLPQNMERLLTEVQEIYFSGVENITTQEQHQAFLILSYVHIMLFMCEKSKISILEALCKDDKDRGNVIKTIFKLHFLYLTGQISHETLTSVLVHTLARPFILQKNAIIKTRLVLLERVIPFIKEARDRNAQPRTFIFGDVQNASYRVAKPPGQTIRPSNASSRNLEEYKAFLETHLPVHMHYNGNLIQELSQEFYPADGERKDAMIMQRISGAARNMNIKTGELLLMAPPNPSAEQESRYYTETVHTTILAFLTVRAGLSIGDAWKVSCAFQPGLGQKLHDHLNGIFGNRILGVSVKLDEPSLNTADCGILLTDGVDTARLKFTAIYNIVDRNTVIGKIKASMVILDHRTGQAQFEYSLDV